ncbi:MAG: FlgD immunoglobulin-like domain containing protein, partial [Acidobacteriota bacterium]
FVGRGVCGYSVIWSTGPRVLVAVGTFSDVGYFYDIDLASEPPQARVVGADGRLTCGSGGGFESSDGGAPAEKLPGRGTELPMLAADFERGRATWAVTGSTYNYVPSLDGGGDPEKGSGDRAFEVVWADADGSSPAPTRAAGPVAASQIPSPSPAPTGARGPFGAATIDVSVIDLEEGAEARQVSLELDLPPWAPPTASLSSDGFVVAYYDRYGGYGELGGSTPEPAAADGPDDGPDLLAERRGRAAWLERGLLPADPEIPARAGVAGGSSPADKGGGEGGDQFIVRWDRAEERELPFALGRALWTPVDKYLVGSLETSTFETDGLVPYFTPAANLTTRIRPRVLFGDAGVDLWVLATDRYLDFYQIDYLDLDDTAAGYFELGLPSDEPLFGEQWGTWLPPANGRYRVRVTARDRAGNVRSASRRVVWNGDNDIANLYLEERYVSPRSSPGVQDALIFHYTVLRPANLDFEIRTEDGATLARLPVAADTVGPTSTSWDGADGAGNPLPDGRYLLALGEATWPFVIDNTPPRVTLRFEEPKIVVEVPDRVGFFDEDLRVAELFAAVQDDNMAAWDYASERASAPGERAILRSGTRPFSADADVAWAVYSTDRLVRRTLRLEARDLAGNSSVTSRSLRDEQLLFTDSEPVCRTALEPCLFPDREPIDDVRDSGGFLVADEFVLQPFYDTLLVQSSVWTDVLDVEQ